MLLVLLMLLLIMMLRCIWSFAFLQEWAMSISGQAALTKGRRASESLYCVSSDLHCVYKLNTVFAFQKNHSSFHLSDSSGCQRGSRWHTRTGTLASRTTSSTRTGNRNTASSCGTGTARVSDGTTHPAPSRPSSSAKSENKRVRIKKFKRGAGERGVFNSRSRREDTLCVEWLELTWSCEKILVKEFVALLMFFVRFSCKTCWKVFAKSKFTSRVRQVPERVTDWLERILLGVSEK